ncbi:MAG: hypothetical protein AAGC46_04625 [Solirubrobacteraceae bacterium]|nr:hypothetical protein [Patulibacter sp.]
MRKPAAAATALLLTALPLIGCGGDAVDKNAYVKAVSAVQAKTSGDAQKLSTEMQTAKTPKDIAEKLTELGTAVQSDADDLARIKAPEEVTQDHQQYVQLMRDFGSNLKDLAPQVEKATPTTVSNVLKKATGYTTTLSTKEAKLISDINAQLQK